MSQDGKARHLSLVEARRAPWHRLDSRVDLRGLRSGRLLALEPVAVDIHRRVIWLCSCECGSTTRVTVSNFRHVKSCGCLSKIAHARRHLEACKRALVEAERRVRDLAPRGESR